MKLITYVGTRHFVFENEGTPKKSSFEEMKKAIEENVIVRQTGKIEKGKEFSVTICKRSK